jgi:uncharacterized protein YpmB
MTIGNSLLAALIIMAIVFTVLAALFLLVNFQTRFFASFRKPNAANNVQAVSNTVSNTKAIEASNGEIEITGLDEKTAAMVMAIAADDLKIPLNELQFKSIKLLD